jgi:plasmid stabilization system protein ParE
MNFEFHPEAERELDEAAFRYEREVAGLGRRFASEVERAVEVLLERPEIGARLDDNLRHFVLRKFSLLHHLRHFRESVVHRRRRPWQPRTWILAVSGS